MAELYAELRPSLVRALVATAGSYRGVEDAVQEAFVAFLRADRERIASPAGWLYRVALRALRRQTGRGWLPFAPTRPDVPLETTLLDQVVARVDLVAVLRRLSTRDRQLVVARYWLGLHQDELAAEFGLSRGTVSAAISRANLQMRAALDGEVVQA